MGKQAKRYFEDLREGEEFTCAEVLVDREEIIEFATRYDPQPFHVDEAAAEASQFGGLVASSLHTLSLCTRVVVEAIGDVAVCTGVGMLETRMHAPVRPGDRLRVLAGWQGLKRSESRPDRGIARLACRVFNQRDELVLEYGYVYMVYCRPA